MTHQVKEMPTRQTIPLVHHDIETIRTFTKTLPDAQLHAEDINSLIPFVAMELFAKHTGMCDDAMRLLPLTDRTIQLIHAFTTNHVSINIEENDTCIAYIRMFIGARYMDETDSAGRLVHEIVSRKRDHRSVWYRAHSFCSELPWAKDLASRARAS